MVLLYCGRVGRRRVFIKAHPSKRWAFLFYIPFFPISTIAALSPIGPIPPMLSLNSSGIIVLFNRIIPIYAPPSFEHRGEEHEVPYQCS